MQMEIILLLLKCLDIKKRYFLVQVRCQIHAFIMEPQKSKSIKGEGVSTLNSTMSEVIKSHFFSEVFDFVYHSIKSSKLECTAGYSRHQKSPMNLPLDKMWI
jgi:hypothetical protein